MLCVPAGLAQEPAQTQKYQIIVVRGDNATNRVKKGRATSQTVVEVRDENNVPVAGIIVTFTLPTLGPGGVFTSGGAMTTVTTNAAGQATATFTPNSLAGSFNIGVSANVPGQAPVTASVSQTNTLAAAAAAGGGVSGATIGIIVAVAAAGAAGAAFGLKGKSSTPGSNPTPGPPTPSGPTPIRIGIGGTPTVGPR